ncbi:MAG: LarC family nickel insertion protein, partial [Treponema sp.]|nr:LarC family nickel insertion protein [Treponema sp.]
MSGNSLWFECNAGISGDMAVAALLDAGADREELDKALASIPAEGFSVEVRRVLKSGIDALDFDVKLDEAHENHDHDMEYLFGHEHGGGQHCHGEGHGQHHDDAHGHGGQHHEHRTLDDVLGIIDATEMTGGARELARRIFGIIAAAEGRAHNLPPEEVHFHEVGAVDSVVDVIALSVCFDNLRRVYGIGRVYVPYLAEGTGTVRCQHGILPIPVPAVSDIVSEHGIPLRMVPDRGEFVTPTGAAFVAAVATDFRLPPEL